MRPRSGGHATVRVRCSATLAVLACARKGPSRGAGQWRRGRLRPLPQRVPGAHCALNAQDDAATGRCVRGAPGRRLPCRKVEQKYARRRRVLRRAAAAYGVVYLAFYSARDVQTLTNQRGTQRLTMVHRWVLSTRQFGIVFSCVPRPVEIAISRPRLTFVPRVVFTGTATLYGSRTPWRASVNQFEQASSPPV